MRQHNANIPDASLTEIKKGSAMNGNIRLTLVAVLAVTHVWEQRLPANEPPGQSFARLDSMVTDLAFFRMEGD